MTCNPITQDLPLQSFVENAFINGIEIKRKDFPKLTFKCEV